MKALLSKIQEVSKYIEQADVLNQKVSNWTIGKQIDHISKVNYAVIKALKSSNPVEFKSSFNLYKTIFLTLGIFPRGKAKAPKAVVPTDQITKEELSKKLDNVIEQIKELETLPNSVHFNHPYFGVLNKKESIEFMKVHTNHHLKIIKDIVK